MVKVFIAGIDPGTTVGIAILDLHGEIRDISSFRNFSADDIVDHLLNFGIPIIIATDVHDVHHTVEKISAAFGCKTFAPSTSLSVKEKNEITKEYTFANAHERDALASVLKAYDHYKTKFENIDARLEDRGAKNLSSAVKTLVLKDYTVKSAIDALTHEEEPEEKIIPKKTPHKRNNLLEKKIIERLRGYNRELSEKIKTLERKNKQLRRKNRKIFNEIDKEVRRSKIIKEKERTIQALSREIERKKKEILELRMIIKGLKGIRSLELLEEAYTVKILDYFTKMSINDLDRKFKIKKGDILLIRDPSGGGGSTAELLVKKQIRALILENQERMSHNARQVFENEGVPLLAVTVQVVDPFGAVEKDEFETAYKEWEMKRELQSAEEKEQWLNELLEQYKKERIKKLK
jgi:hypothetical protein